MTTRSGPTRGDDSSELGNDAGQVERSERWYPHVLKKKEIELLRRRRDAVLLDDEDGASPPDSELPCGTVGLALSGGGIRSATFCLGVLQSLARKKLIGKIDYLSTVSGGGYIGSFFGGLFTRKWQNTGANKVGRVESILADSQSEPLKWLRDNGRYLAPNGAGDSWLAAAVIVRNLIAVHTMMALLVMTVFLFTHWVRTLIPAGPNEAATAVSGGVLKGITDIFPVLGWPLFADDGRLAMWWSPWVALPILVIVVWSAPMCWAYWLTSVDTRGKASMWTWLATLAAIAGSAVGAWLLFNGTSIMDFSEAVAVGLAIVVIVGLVAVLGYTATAAYVWMRRKIMRQDRREKEKETDSESTPEPLPTKLWLRNRLSRWLSRSLMFVVGLAVFALVDSFGQTIYTGIKTHGLTDYRISIKTLPPLAFALSLIAFAEKIVKTLSSVSSGTKKRKRNTPWDLVAGAAAVVVAVVLLILASTVSFWVAWQGKSPPDTELLFWQATQAVPPDVPQISGLHCFVGFVACALLSLSLGQTEYFLNLSSHVTLYSARLARAYLGASNKARLLEPENRRLTDVHEDDPITMEDYRPFNHGGPLHLINLTLNETVSGSSQIEHRDRKGLSFAVGPAGISVGSEHHGLWTDGTRGREIETGRIRPIIHEGDLYHPLAPTNREETELDPTGHGVQKRRLEQWIAASGAAFTTGLGWRTSLGASLLMAIGNVRLGHWWDSHVESKARRLEGTPGKTKPTYREGSPIPPVPVSRTARFFTWLLPVHSYFTEEASARFFGPQKRYWYLSDGGHFENTGCYELIRRRVPLIICCDCGADPDYAFADLANLVRKARIDFGAEVVFHDQDVCPKMLETVESCSCSCLGLLEDLRKSAATTKPDDDAESNGHPATHAAIGCIYYPKPGANGRPRHPRPSEDEVGSLLIVLKPSLTIDEPLDVQLYGRANEDFPQETTGDQFFDEAQWESYRRLGVHIADKVLTEELFEVAKKFGAPGGPVERSALARSAAGRPDDPRHSLVIAFGTDGRWLERVASLLSAVARSLNPMRSRCLTSRPGG